MKREGLQYMSATLRWLVQEKLNEYNSRIKNNTTWDPEYIQYLNEKEEITDEEEMILSEGEQQKFNRRMGIVE